MKKPLWIWIISLALAAFWGCTLPALAETPTAYVRGWPCWPLPSCWCSYSAA